MILNGKDVDIDKLMQQLAAIFFPKGSKYGEEKRDDEQGTPKDQVIDNEIILQGGEILGFN
jgi:hypothetical protein